MMPCFSNAATALLPSSSGFPDQFFAANFFQGLGENFVCGFGRNYADSVDVPEEDVARAQANGADFQGDAKIHDFVTWRGILTIRAPGESRKIQFKDGFGVASIAVQDGPARAQLAGPNAHQLSPQARCAGTIRC